jgi:hypothetical protein
MDGMLGRLWVNLIGRIDGPLTLRLVLQPTTAAVFALRAGWKDARQGRVPYGWVILRDPIQRRDLLHEGWKDVAKVFVVTVIIDLVYQVIELRWFYPEEAVIVAAILALIPYLLLRGPANRIARRLQHAQELN